MSLQTRASGGGRHSKKANPSAAGDTVIKKTEQVKIEKEKSKVIFIF